eukprot:XP_010646758.1 PREDICTED: disease resistance protein RML1A-like [Vitis vinifera]
MGVCMDVAGLGWSDGSFVWPCKHGGMSLTNIGAWIPPPLLSPGSRCYLPRQAITPICCSSPQQHCLLTTFMAAIPLWLPVPSGSLLEKRYESQIIQGIVRRISKMLNCRPELLYLPDNLVGINSRIHGIAGIGKTTLAQGIYNQIAHQFEDARFLSNVAEVEEHRGSLELQRQLLEDILWPKIARISNIDEGISLIKKTLCSRKVLIILDDVSALTQLEFLAGSHHWFGSGSRIIITTRNKHLLDVHEVDELYEVEKLNSEEALQLFSLWAFKADLPRDGFWDLSGRALNYCDGLPLAVKVVGSLLYGRRKLEWENTLLKLQTVGERNVQKVLRLSYDRLDHTEKDLFLDIACSSEGRTQILLEEYLIVATSLQLEWKFSKIVLSSVF